MAPDKGHQENQPILSNHDTGLGNKSWPSLCFPWEDSESSSKAPPPLMVDPIPGERCRTQATTTAGSGDLQPKFDEEACVPLWCKMSVLPSLTLSSATSLGKCQAQAPGVPPAALGDQARHRTSL